MSQIVNKKSVLEMAMGAIAEITDYEVERVVANIMDPNTAAKAKRKITITLTFTPDDYRQQIGMDAQAKTSLVPVQPVQPIVHLQPYRTFLEVAQPASDFLLRIDKDGHPALYEADGGAWKLEAKRSIAAYLGGQLADLVESGNVVVMI